jgi:hypothetical protein
MRRRLIALASLCWMSLQITSSAWALPVTPAYVEGVFVLARMETNTVVPNAAPLCTEIYSDGIVTYRGRVVARLPASRIVALIEQINHALQAESEELVDMDVGDDHMTGGVISYEGRRADGSMLQIARMQGGHRFFLAGKEGVSRGWMNILNGFAQLGVW